ncbi:MAG TPA: hypothetical protein VHG52_01390, partial [Thermomicrobiales bacterium]|nr:hypothetical protein [Thermomicrobiales bacterium]
MEGLLARPRLMPLVARRVPPEAGRLHSKMSRHASWARQGPRFLAHDRWTPAGRGPVLTRRQALLGATGAGLMATLPGIRSQTVALQADEPPRPEGPTAPPGTPRPGGRLQVGTPRQPDSLHPWLADTVAAFDVLAGVMDGILRYTAEGKLGPALAEGFSISDDGLTYTFA